MTVFADQSPILEGRGCGSCALCCKVLSIKTLQKPMGQWCGHCQQDKGCKIYDSRPQECATFHCGFLTWSMLGLHWFPAKSKLIVGAQLHGQRIVIHVDPGWANAWRQQPYYAEIKAWAVAGAQERRQVIVRIGKRAIVVLPDREVDLGPIEEDDQIITYERKTAAGLVLDVVKRASDDLQVLGAAALECG